MSSPLTRSTNVSMFSAARSIVRLVDAACFQGFLDLLKSPLGREWKLNVTPGLQGLRR